MNLASSNRGWRRSGWAQCPRSCWAASAPSSLPCFGLGCFRSCGGRIGWCASGDEYAVDETAFEVVYSVKAAASRRTPYGRRYFANFWAQWRLGLVWLEYLLPEEAYLRLGNPLPWAEGSLHASGARSPATSDDRSDA